MAKKIEIDTNWTRDTRNALDANFDFLFNQYRQAGMDAEEARKRAVEALSNSVDAKDLSERTQKELSQAILEGDSSPLAGQLSVGADGTVHHDPQERLVKEHNSVSAQLAQNMYLANSLKNSKADRAEVQSFESMLNDIIVSNGDGSKDTELIASRGSFDTLGERLNNYSSDINGLLTAIPSLRNRARNGDFSEGTSYWNTSGTVSLLSAEDNVLTVQPNPANASKRIYLGKLSLDIPANHKVYIGYVLRASKNGSFNMGIGTGSLGSTIVASENKSATTEETYTSNFFTAGANGANWFRINATEYTSDSDFFEVQYVLVVDLTATFGAGKEPTRADMDDYFQRTGWFDGGKKLTVNDVVEFKVNSIGGGGSLDDIAVVNGAGNGQTDDTTAIQAALNSGAGGLVLLPKGEFLVSQTLYIPDDTTFVGMGLGSKIKLSNNHSLESISWRTFDGGHIIKPILTNNRNSAQAKNIFVKGIHIVGEGVTDSERMGGLIFADAYNCHAEEVYVNYINWVEQNTINNRGFNIACVRSEKISFIKTMTDHAGYECIGAFDDSKDVIIKSNFIGTGKRCSAQLHRNNFNILFDSNIVKQDQDYFTDAHGCLVIHGSSTRPAKNLIISNNHFEEKSAFAMVSFVEFQEDCTVKGNHFIGEDIIGLRINGVNRNFTVTDNFIKVNRTGITVTSQGSVLMANNNIDAASLSGHAVDLVNVESAIMQGNSVKSGRHGINIGTVAKGVIVDKNIIDAEWNTFAGDYSDNPKVMIGQNIA